MAEYFFIQRVQRGTFYTNYQNCKAGGEHIDRMLMIERIEKKTPNSLQFTIPILQDGTSNEQMMPFNAEAKHDLLQSVTEGDIAELNLHLTPDGKLTVAGLKNFKDKFNLEQYHTVMPLAETDSTLFPNYDMVSLYNEQKKQQQQQQQQQGGDDS
ncbi:hypothetical protein PPL_10172 [Heterostelium album PN500]|uniref:Uncharacterized protein n=1 Tax=Heterostelium pallidum (strain ATCC 26659 / Pp 5 / PN500) TaxID=670386 RepID=D3BQI7_HETP5|nr:hypothetical protein PPL_10172 [Heterostelium album PN500]EFA76407.1 hypothetical protein PPL_10172 [Heterostelium album PN500]|eukprot:XP_020428539.1 hypothetical protein PPL_10172 [Heterostelium album PN500]